LGTPGVLPLPGGRPLRPLTPAIFCSAYFENASYSICRQLSRRNVLAATVFLAAAALVFYFPRRVQKFSPSRAASRALCT
jgi:hypothetical protein